MNRGLLPMAVIAMIWHENVSAGAPQPSADLVVVHAVVRTMDPSRPAAEAIAVSGGRISAVGDSREIQKLAGAKTRVMDARGRLIVPGHSAD